MASHIGWDIAFALGVLVQLTKLTDLLMRPHQQRWIQRSAEMITLRLAYLKPLQLYPRLVKKKSALVFVVVLELVLVVTIVLGSMHELFLGDRHPTGWNYFATILGSIALLIVAPLALVRYLNQVMDWLFSRDRFVSFLVRFIALAIAGYVVCSGLVTFYGATIVESETPLGPIMGLLLLFVGTTLFLTLAALGTTIILLQIILTVTTIFVGGVRFLAWRIVEYNKGAWAAISLLLTILVGIVDIWTRLSTK